MGTVRGDVLGTQLCEALGIAGEEWLVTGIRIEAHVGDVARISIHRLVKDDIGDQLVDVVDTYELTEATDG